MEQLLKILENNARLPVEDIATMLNKSPAEVAAMMDLARAQGIIKGYKTLVDWEKAKVNRVEAVIELNVSPKKSRGFDEIAATIAAFDEVESVLLMSGGYDLQLVIKGQTFQEIALFVAKRLSPLDDVLSTATHFVLRTYKKEGRLYQDEEIDKLIAPAAAAMRPSGIRKFFDLAAEMPECISLGVGEPDFKTPWAVREAGIESLEHGRTRYTSNAGLKELRAEICRYLERRMHLHYDPLREVLVTVGGSEAIDMCIRTLVKPGDEVIIPEPCFVCYEPITTLSGGVPVHVACRQEDEFRLRAEALKAAITPKTKLVIMPFPNNPTGAVMEREDLEAVAEVLRGTDIMVLSDEIYAELNYGLRPHVSIATLPGMAERTIVVNGFSKSYAMTGWRLGYACGPEAVIKIMTKIHQSAIMSAPTTSQYAAITALKECDGEIDRMRDEYNMRRRLVVRSFNDMGLTCFEPRGAFYAFPCIKSTGMSSQEFCTKLLEQKHVAIIPGDAFGASGEGYCRVSYAYSVEHLTEALKRIREFLVENNIYHGN